MSIQLKIKAKHLALEPKVIRHEEQKLKKQIKYKTENNQSLPNQAQLIRDLNSLVNHRKFEVRNESRATYLAIAFLKGKPYASIEQKRLDEVLFRGYIVPRIVSMVQKYRYTANNPELLRQLMGKEITREMILEWAKIN